MNSSNYNNFYWNSDECNINVNLKGENNDIYHGPSVYSNNYNGASLAASLNFKKSYFLNYDYILKDKSGIDNISNILDKTSRSSVVILLLSASRLRFGVET